MAQRLISRWTYLGRLIHIGAVLFRFYPLHWLRVSVRRLPWLGGRLEPLPSAPKRFSNMLVELGGSFIKFGQVLSLQPDLVPRAYCDELFDLLDRVPAFDFSEVEKIFREDLGRGPEELFDKFEKQPFASASIGQVHRAQLDGRDLAVKVRRPTARRDFGGDIRLMKVAVDIITSLRLKRLYPFRMPIREFIAWTKDELDYRTEARYMTQVGLNTDAGAVARIPDVMRDFSTARILATEYLEGTTLLEYLRSLERNDPAVAYRLSKAGFQPTVFAENVFANFLGDVFQHGIFHADLHPANLLILPDNVVGYVDFGITGVISDYGREHFVGLIRALSRYDIDALYRGVLRISEISEDSDLERFHKGLQELSGTWFERRDGETKLVKSYTVFILDLIRLSRDCRLFPHDETMRYMRSVTTVDGLIARFAPEYDVSARVERLTGRHQRRQVLAKTVSSDQMIETWIAGSRLVRDGAARFDALLDRLEHKGRDRSGVKEDRSRGGAKAAAAKASRFGLIAVIVALLLVFGEQPPDFGFNLVTAEWLLFGSATILLARSILRWLDLEH